MVNIKESSRKRKAAVLRRNVEKKKSRIEQVFTDMFHLLCSTIGINYRYKKILFYQTVHNTIATVIS